MKRLLLALACAVLLSACTTQRPVVQTAMPKLHLPTFETTRTTWGMSAAVTLPPGDYRAMYQDAAGIFYAPEGKILINGRPADDMTVLVEDGQAVALWAEGAKIVDRFERPVRLGR